MGVPSGQAVSGTLAAIQRACLRLNPCMDLDVDLLAVTRAAAVSTSADWAAQSLPAAFAIDSYSGAVTLSATGSAVLFNQNNADTSVAHYLTDGHASFANKGREEYAFDYFPDPSVFGTASFTLKSLAVYLSCINKGLNGFFTAKDSTFRVFVNAYDARWRLVPLCDPIDIAASAVITYLNGLSGVYPIDLTQGGRHVVFEPGLVTSRTGPGLNGLSTRTLNPDITGASTIVAPRGLSISIVAMGTGFQFAYVGCAAAATLAQFATSSFWRPAANRNMGPFDPAIVGYGGTDVLHNPDDHLTTGAIPGYGAVVGSDAVSQWGIARRVQVAQIGQDDASSWGEGGVNGWERPYNVLSAVAFTATGTMTPTLDLLGVPVNPVQIRLNDFQPTGTSIAYTLSGSATGVAGPWTAIGTVTDGQILTGANLYRYYQLTAVFTAGGGATKFSTPSLLAWQMIERIAISTYRYLADFDAEATIDPVTGQSGVSELKLPILRGGVRNFRDLGTIVSSQYTQSAIEAHVFARNTVTGERLFLNSFRLENRDPQDGVEEMTFTGGMDLLSALVPPAVMSYSFPSQGSAYAPITVLGGILNFNPNPANTRLISVGVAGTPFAGQTLAGMRYHGVTGAAAGFDYRITTDIPRDGAGNALTAGSGFVIDTNSITVAGVATGGPVPALTDTFQIFSDTYTRGPLTYPGQDFAALATDLLNVQSGVPARYRGQLPVLTAPRLSGAYTLPPAGIKAAEVLAAVGLHCGGAFAWIGGRVTFVDIYSPNKVSQVTWDERHYTQNLKTPVGGDRRMPSIKTKYAYQADTKQFAFEIQTDDADAIYGVGRSNLFDTFDVPDSVCVWNDAAGTEAQYIARMLQSAWKTGVRLWDVETVLCYPWLELGGCITLMTDQYTDRRLHFAADGVTDLGQPIAGRVAVIGVIIGKNLWGNKWKIAVRGLDSVTAAPTAGVGNVPGTTTVPAVPNPSITFDGAGQAIVSVVGDAKTANIRYVVRNDRAPTAAEVRATANVAGNNLINVASGVTVALSGTGWIGALAYNTAGDESVLGVTSQARSNVAAPSLQIVPHLTNNQVDDTTDPVTLAVAVDNLPSAYTWTLKSGYTHGNYPTAVDSGSNAANPLTAYTLAVHPRAKWSTWYQLVVTVAGSNYADVSLVQSFMSFVNPSGQPVRSQPWSDGGYGFKSTDPSGYAMDSNAVDSGARNANKFYAKGLSGDPDSADAFSGHDGLSYGITTFNQRTGGGRGYAGLDSGNVLVAGSADFSRGYTNKHAGYIPRSAIDATAVSTIVQSIDNSGNAQSTMLDTGGRPINKFFAKALSGNPDQLDSVPDGASYSRSLATRINAGRPWIDFSEGIHANKTADYIGTGASYDVVAVGYIDSSKRPNALYRTSGAQSVTADVLGSWIGTDAAEMVVNGGGQSGPIGTAATNEASGWTYDIGASNLFCAVLTQSKIGDRCLRLSHTSASRSYSHQAIALKGGVPYVIGAWIAYNGIETSTTEGVYIEVDAPSSVQVLDYSAQLVIGVGSTVVSLGVAFNPGNDGAWRHVQMVIVPSVDLTVTLYLAFGAVGTTRVGEAFFDGVSCQPVGANSAIGGYRGSLGLDLNGNAQPTMLDSGARAINKFFAKPLSSNPDDLSAVPNDSVGGHYSVLALDVNRRPIADFASAHLNKTVDSIGDGATYSRTAATRVNAGRPLIDFSEAIHLNKTVDNIGDGATHQLAGGGRAYPTISGAQSLTPGTVQTDSVTPRVMMRGYQTGTARHGDAVTFSPVYQNAPKFRIGGAINQEPRAKWGATGSGSETTAVNTALPQIKDVGADSLSTSGFTVRARLRQPGTTTANVTTWPGTVTLTVVAAVTSNVAPSAASNDNNYKAIGTLTPAVAWDPSVGGVQTESVTVALDVDPLNTGVWTEVATQTGSYSRSSSGSGSSVINLSLTASRSGLTSSSQFRLRIKTEVNNAGSGSFSMTATSLNYNTASGDQYANATVDTGLSVVWETWESASGT